MRVALLEVSHWHVPLYLDALEAPGIEVVAVSDAEHVEGRGNRRTIRKQAVLVGL